MPRAALTPQNRIQNALHEEEKRCMGWLKAEGIPKSRIAEMTGKTDRQVRHEFQVGVLQPDTRMAILLLEKGGKK